MGTKHGTGAKPRARNKPFSLALRFLTLAILISTVSLVKHFIACSESKSIRTQRLLAIILQQVPPESRLTLS